MNIEMYEKLMSCLDVIEAELNKVAEIVGSCSFSEFVAEEKAKAQPYVDIQDVKEAA